jgi:hypothetical protein
MRDLLSRRRNFFSEALSALALTPAANRVFVKRAGQVQDPPA